MGTVALLKIPKYCPGSAPGGEVELERTKARPKPGLVLISGRIEKTNEVENDEMFEAESFIGIREG